MEQEPKYKDEMDWKDLIRKPEKLFGYSYFYLLIVMVGLGVLYLLNLNSVGRNMIAPTLADSVAQAKDIPFQYPQVIPPLDVMKAGMASGEAVNKGKELYKANCASCHGDNGLGDGAAALMLSPKPRNFTFSTGWKNGTKVSQIYKTLEEGMPGSGMSSFKYLQPSDRFALIHFVRTFASNSPSDSPEDLRLLDATYQLSRGVTVTGQVPIRKATLIMVKESEPHIAALQQAIKTVEENQSVGAKIFQAIAQDKRKALAVVLSKQDKLVNTDALIALVTAQPIQSGFKPGAARLSSEEWSELFQFVQSLRK